MYSFPDLKPVCGFMSSSNCCFLTCIQISQEAGQVVWYSHLFQNFPVFSLELTFPSWLKSSVKYSVVFWILCPDTLANIGFSSFLVGTQSLPSVRSEGLEIVSSGSFLGFFPWPHVVSWHPCANHYSPEDSRCPLQLSATASFCSSSSEF